MNKTLRLSLLYLFLIIPQHGNSPIPRMESWLEMNQGDDFVDWDLTSSLTRAESFGSAHRNYQNTLIRKKQTDKKDETSVENPPENYFDSFANHVQRNLLSDNQMHNVNYKCCKYLAEDEPKHIAYELSRATGNGHRNYRMKQSPKNEEGYNSELGRQNYANDKFAGDSPFKRINEDDSKSRRSVPGSDRRRNCAILPRETEVISKPESEGIELSKLHSGYNEKVAEEKERQLIENEELSRGLKNNLRQEDAESNQLWGKKERLMEFDRDGEEYPNMEEKEYYYKEKNFAPVRMNSSDIADIDYRQINSHSTIRKREGSQRIHLKSVGKCRRSGGGPAELESRESKRVEGSGSDSVSEAVFSRGNEEMEGKNYPDSRSVNGKTNSNVESREAIGTAGNSGRVPEEVEVRSRESVIEPQFDNGKTDGYFIEAKPAIGEDSRNKREDEDEQKNMKTGTDEGGGEYEDEEGRGHNDEEEYYEEAEVSVSAGETVRASERLPNRKLYKRKALKDSRRKKASKGKEESLASNTTIFDYKLTLENAPVENDVKSKKSSLIEGMQLKSRTYVLTGISKKKIVTRKGSKIWDHWGEWSPCSKTCGIGRTSRWRHCIGGGCAQGEKEALIKKCTNPAC